MREVDRLTTEQFGIPSTTLMENAGAAVAHFVLREFPEHNRITVLCGKGNNGGDGFVAARHLAEAGRAVAVVLLGNPADQKGGAEAMFAQLPSAPFLLTDEVNLDDVPILDLFEATDLFLDAIVGTGFRPPLRGIAAALADRINRLKAAIVGVDLPSGWDADSRQPDSPGAFRADAVVTFTAPKFAHLFGNMTRGGIVVASIGSPEETIQSTTGLTWAGESATVTHTPRVPDSNKGMYGHVLVVAGARGTGGAAAMASVSALRAGAGLVTAAIPASILPNVAQAALELMTVPMLEGENGEISSANLAPDRLKALLERATVLAVGPGLGQHPETEKFVLEFVSQTKQPLVLDADALNMLAKDPSKINGRDRPLVITPHPGEMARLIGGTVKDVQSNREGVARNFAQTHNVTVVLKGWRTLIAHPDGAIAVNTTGNPGMAKGGSGDLLTGMVAAMLAQYPKDPKLAVEAAVYLHGLAADITVQSPGIGGNQHTLLATDSLANLHTAFHYHPQAASGNVWLQGSPADA